VVLEPLEHVNFGVKIGRKHTTSLYCHDLGVTIDGVLDWMIGFIALMHHTHNHKYS
jgi:hypothetical protein